MPNPQPKVNPGLVNHFIDTDGGTLNVSTGYIPALGYGVAGGITSALAAFALSKGRTTSQLKKMVLDSAVKGGVVGVGLSEIRRRKSDKLRKGDRTSFDAVIRERYKPVVPGFVAATRTATNLAGNFINSQYTIAESNNEDLFKDAEYNKEVIRKKLDKDATDEAIGEIATSIVAPLMIHSFSASPVRDPKAAIKALANLNGIGHLPGVLNNASRSGTRYMSVDEFKKTIEHTKNMHPENLRAGNIHGAIAIDPGDLGASTFAREVERAALREGKNPFFSSVLNTNASKIVGGLNTGYAFISDADNRIADATALAQAAVYTPRIIEDVKSIRSAMKKLPRLDHSKQIPYLLARSLPGLMPLIGRVWKKLTNKDS